MNCQLLKRHIDALVDGEVDPATQIEFEKHLAGCGACRQHLMFAQAFKVQVKEVLAGSVRAPETLRKRLLSACEQRGDDGAWFRFVPVRGVYAVPAAIATLIVIFGSFSSVVGDEHGSRASALPVFEDVVQRHSLEFPAEVRATEGEQVSSWFRGKLRFPVRPVEFRQQGVRLTGARLSNVRERLAATLYYDVGGRRVTVLVFEPFGAPSEGLNRARFRGRELYYQRVRGYTVAMMQHDGIAYAVSGDLDQDSLLRLVATAKVR